jgi:hypothetical protein
VEGAEFPPGVSQIQEQIETKFRQLPHVFGVQLFNGANADIVERTIQPEFQDGGSKTEVPYLGPYLGRKMSKVIIILSGTTNARKGRVTLDALLTTP